MRLLSAYLTPGLILLSQCKYKSISEPTNLKPNIIIILADDLGYSDLGCYGSEIKTPNLDKMAAEGLQMTQFYNCARCCPSRASLLTGLYPAQCGMGHMSFGLTHQPDGNHLESYQGYFPENVPTIADVLKNEGYQTIHVGKWHVGDKPEHHPLKHGFNKVYGKNAGGHYFNHKQFLTKLWYNDSTVNLEDGKYLTDAFTEHAIQFIYETPQEKPFFLYLAYTAPHFPVQAYPEDVERYIPIYEQGWDSIRNNRFTRMRDLQLIPNNWTMTKSYEEEGVVPKWNDLEDEEKKKWVRRMATHAAMTEHMDNGIGQIADYLEKNKKLDNTVILFLSDNGADSWDVYNKYQNRRDPESEIGLPGSFDGIGPAWANMCNAPFWLFKSWTAEGGIATPFIAYGPKYIKSGTLDTQNTGIIMDIIPTCVELAGGTFPKTHNNLNATPLAGASLTQIFKAETIDTNKIYCWEHQGHKAIRKGNWKLVYIRENKHALQCEWFLFNLKNDRTERLNIINEYPDKAEELKVLWEQWASETGVVPWKEVNAWNPEWECEN